ncbi:hypothetical protein [uncultured Ilumatobacter sp.]|uniref:hypothetical protein n=1 Tax=uncultured Ilumatobacter sp. TaxID=879968 RepID=UPI00374F011A
MTATVLAMHRREPNPPPTKIVWASSHTSSVPAGPPGAAKTLPTIGEGQRHLDTH